MKEKLSLMWDYFKQILHLLGKEVVLLIQIILAFTAPIQMLMILVGLAIIADTIIGVMKAKEIKEPITSRKLSRAVSKMVLYQLAMISFFALDKFLLGEFALSFTSIPLIITKIIATFLIVIEVKSINESIVQGWNVNVYEKFKRMLNRAKNIKDSLTEIGKKE